ncbi:MAG: type III PLP-dependent enzyme [Alphaproteobacteria bacterium]
MVRYTSVQEVAKKARPSLPVYIHRPKVISNMAGNFLKNFPGEVLYAVKTNPTEFALRELMASGITNFDVASIKEIKLIARLAKKFAVKAELYFMNVVKSPEAIHEAYFKYGVRNFVLDSEVELIKILSSTKGANDLNLFLRLSIKNDYAEIPLFEKFGIDPTKAASNTTELMQKTRKYAYKFGIAFHVGSQCMHPTAYKNSIAVAMEAVKKAGVKLDVLDIGGGFPVQYTGMLPPPLNFYFEIIKKELKRQKLLGTTKIICEPGRALVAESGSILARVELRKGNFLYINDGTYGNLFDAGYPAFNFPVRAIRNKGELEQEKIGFSFYGPTCDSLDFMSGPFYLPKDIKEGDYIEIGQLGSYSTAMSSKFNGFGDTIFAEVEEGSIVKGYLSNDFAKEELPAYARKKAGKTSVDLLKKG